MFRRTFTRTVACFAVAAMLSVGCEEKKPAPTPPVATPPAAPVAKLDNELQTEEADTVEPARPPLVLESTEQALDEMIAAVDERRTHDYQEIEAYLHGRGPELVPSIEKRLESDDLSPAAQIGLVRQLSAAGEPALPTLEKLTAKDRDPIVRINAIDQICRVRPVTERATDFLRSILREGEPRDRVEALKALDRMGANSEGFVDDLREIMASDAPEDLRVQAKKSLDRAKPRKTFEDRG